MKAIDANIVLRVLLNDDPDQTRRAQAVLTSHQVQISTTVFIETDWVLRRSFKQAKASRLTGLRDFCDLPNVFLAEPEKIERAFELAELGLEIADAVHVAGTTDCEAFVTFDGPFIKAASAIEGLQVEAPPR